MGHTNKCGGDTVSDIFKTQTDYGFSFAKDLTK